MVRNDGLSRPRAGDDNDDDTDGPMSASRRRGGRRQRSAAIRGGAPRVSRRRERPDRGSGVPDPLDAGRFGGRVLDDPEGGGGTGERVAISGARSIDRGDPPYRRGVARRRAGGDRGALDADRNLPATTTPGNALPLGAADRVGPKRPPSLVDLDGTGETVPADESDCDDRDCGGRFLDYGSDPGDHIFEAADTGDDRSGGGTPTEVGGIDSSVDTDVLSEHVVMAMAQVSERENEELGR